MLLYLGCDRIYCKLLSFHLSIAIILNFIFTTILLTMRLILLYDIDLPELTWWTYMLVIILHFFMFWCSLFHRYIPIRHISVSPNILQLTLLLTPPTLTHPIILTITEQPTIFRALTVSHHLRPTQLVKIMLLMLIIFKLKPTDTRVSSESTRIVLLLFSWPV